MPLIVAFFFHLMLNNGVGGAAADSGFKTRVVIVKKKMCNMIKFKEKVR